MVQITLTPNTAIEGWNVTVKCGNDETKYWSDSVTDAFTKAHFWLAKD